LENFIKNNLCKASRRRARERDSKNWSRDTSRDSITARHSFLDCVNALNTQPHNWRVSMWQEHLAGKSNKLTITSQESLHPGSSEMWPF